MLEEAGANPGLSKLVADPYALNPENSDRGSDGPDQTGAIYDEDFQRWTLPFIMAAINTRVVRRSNALMGFPYGSDFAYDEAILAPAGQGPLKSKLSALAMTGGTAALAVTPLRRLAKRFLPAPGEGPRAAHRVVPTRRRVKASQRAISRMISKSAGDPESSPPSRRRTPRRSARSSPRPRA